MAIHRPRDVVDLAPRVRAGIACTSPLRALLDLGAVAAGSVEEAFELFVIRHLVTPASVREALERHGVHGRAGVGPLQDALRRWPLGRQVPDSPLEIRLARLLLDARLPFVFHPVIEGLEVDFAFPVERLVIEVDGWEFHGTRAAFEADRRRDAVLVAAGWRVLRFTWQQVNGESSLVIGTIRAALSCGPGVHPSRRIRKSLPGSPRS